MAKKLFKDQNGGHLSQDPPDYLGREARIVWRKIVPFLEEEGKVIRIDTALVEFYATQYEIYRNAYKHILKYGEVTAIYTSLQNSKGEVIGEDFVGFKKNPMVQVYDSALKNLIRTGAELGLSPKSRSELLELASPNDKKKPSIADLLNSGSDF